MACKTGFPLLSVSVVRSNEVELDELDQQIRGSACFISRHSFKDMAFQENGIGTIRLLEQHLPCARLKRLLVHVSSMGVTAIRTTRLLSLFHLDNGTTHLPVNSHFFAAKFITHFPSTRAIASQILGDRPLQRFAMKTTKMIAVPRAQPFCRPV